MSKKRNLFKRTTAVILAAAMAFGSIMPVYATDVTEPAATETEAAVVNDAPAFQTNADAETETTPEIAQETSSTEEIAPEAAETRYILYLPKMEGVSYQYDETHRSDEYSTGEYTILLYNAGEDVALQVDTVLDASVLETSSQTVLVSADAAADGSISFTMPEADLMVTFAEKSQTQADAPEVKQEDLSQDEIISQLEADVIETAVPVEQETSADTEADANNILSELYSDEGEIQSEAVTETVIETVTEKETEAVSEEVTFDEEPELYTKTGDDMEQETMLEETECVSEADEAETETDEAESEMNTPESNAGENEAEMAADEADRTATEEEAVIDGLKIFTAGEGYTIDYSGFDKLEEGTVVSYKVTPDEGYYLTDTAVFLVPDDISALVGDYSEVDIENPVGPDAMQVEDDGSISATFHMPSGSVLVAAMAARKRKGGLLRSTIPDDITTKNPWLAVITPTLNYYRYPSSLVRTASATGYKYATVTFSDGTKARYDAYCLEPALALPNGYKSKTKIDNDATYATLVKALYLFSRGDQLNSNKGAVWGQTITDSTGKAINLEKVFADKNITSTANVYATQHVILSKIYSDIRGKGVWNAGTTPNGQSTVSNPITSSGTAWINSVIKMIENVDMPIVDLTPASISRSSVSVSGTTKRTPDIKYTAYRENALKLNVGSAVSVYTSSGTLLGSGTVSIPGGTSFYLQTSSEEGQKQYTGECTLFSSGAAYVNVSAHSGDQNVGTVATLNRTPFKLVVDWPDNPKNGYILVRKTISQESVALNASISMEGAVYGIYSDAVCANEVTRITIDSNGTVTSSPLPVGTYYVKEISAPAGLTLDNTVYSAVVPSNGTVEVNSKDAPATGSITIIKKASVDGFENKFSMAGATYSVTDEAGHYRGSITIGDDNRGSLSGLPIGSYTVQETAAPANGAYEIDVEAHAVNVTTAAMDPSVTLTEVPKTGSILIQKIADEYNGNKYIKGIRFLLTYENPDIVPDPLYTGYTDDEGHITVDGLLPGDWTISEDPDSVEDFYSVAPPQTLSVTPDGIATGRYTLVFNNHLVAKPLVLKKADEKTGEGLPGAVFNILDANGRKVALTVSGQSVPTTDFMTDKDGLVTFADPITAGEYTLIEVRGPEGYATKSEGVAFKVSNDENSTVTVTMTDAPTKLYVSKQDLTDSSSELPGAVLVIKDSDDTEVERWTSSNEPHYIEKLPVGKYTLTEITAPGGYATSETVSFEIKDTAEIQRVSMKDAPTRLSISKRDLVNGEEIPGATLVIKDKDANEVARWTSSTEPHYIEKLPVGKYTLTEITAPDGYEKAETVSFEIKDSTEIQKVDMDDAPFREVEISKRSVSGSEEIPGAKLEVKDSAGTVVESWISGTEPHTFKLAAGTYTLTERVPANGYTKAETITFTVEKRTKGDYKTKSVVMIDQPTKLYISKKDITSGEEIPGAKLVIKNSEEKEVASWISTSERHYIEKLPIGKYTLTEITAPDGYEKAETISFEVKDTEAAQFVTMFDSPYRDVEITKSDITEGTPVEGAELEIKDVEGKVWAKWTTTKEPFKFKLPSGTYTLTERIPAKGYATAETISFTVNKRDTKNDVEILKVDMADDVTKVNLRKVDSVHGLNVPGAQMEVRDMDDNVLFKFITKDTPHYIENIPIGKYKLVEVEPPIGFAAAEPLEFEVKDTEQIQEFKMVEEEEPLSQRLFVTKMDSQSNNTAGAGFEFSIYAKDDIVDWAGFVRKDASGVEMKAGYLVGKMTTDEEGSAESSDLYIGSYTIKETAVPAGYKIDDTITRDFTVTQDKAQSEPYIRMMIDNTPITRKIELQKTDAHTGNHVGAGFVYELRADDVRDNGGHIRPGFVKGTLVDTLTTDERGIAVSKDLYIGTYTLKETGRNSGYRIDQGTYSISVTDDKDGDNSLHVIQKVTEEPLMQKISISKQDAQSGHAAGEGFTFDIIAAEDIVDASGEVRTLDGVSLKAGSVIQTLSTDENGSAISKDLYIGRYKVVEKEAAKGYTLNADEHLFEITDDTAFNEKDITVVVINEPVVRTLQLIKKDSHTKNAAGAGFTYELRAVSVLDGSGNVRKGFEEGTLVATLVTDDNGLAQADDLYVGSYTLKETEKGRAAGYKVDETTYQIEIKDEGTEANKKEVKQEVTEEPLMHPVVIEKFDAQTGFAAGAGFKFEIHAAEDVKDGSGNIRTLDGTECKADAVIDTVTTDDTGKAASKELYVGRYYIKEIAVPAGYKLNGEHYPFEISDSDAYYKNVVKVDVQNEPVKRDLRLIKVDSETGNAAGANFEYELTAEKVLDATGHERPGFTSGTKVATLTTDENGIAAAKGLYCGSYTLKETRRQSEYQIDTNTYTITISDAGTLNMLPVIRIVRENPLKKQIAVTKIDAETGNKLDAGFVFEIVMAESAVDGSGHVRKGYEKDKVVDTIVTGENGVATSKALPMGKYRVRESAVNQMSGYAINKKEYPVELYDDMSDLQPMILEIEIDDLPTTLRILKYDLGQEKRLTGITFKITEEGADDGKEYTTDANGEIIVKNLKASTKYSIRETATIPGYNLNTEEYTFTVDKEGLIDGSHLYELTITNQPNVVAISKRDIVEGPEGNELPGAHLVIRDKDGNEIDSWISESEPHMIKEMPAGEYTLTETLIPEGYEIAQSETISFTVRDTLAVQKVIMYNAPYRDVEISKRSLVDGPGGDEIPGAHLELRDSKGDIIDSWVSGEEPHKIKLPSGEYSLTERIPANGYTTAETIVFTVEKRDSEGDYTVTPVVMYDDVTKVVIHKQAFVDGPGGKEVPGATLVIRDRDGNEVERFVSGEEPHYIEKLPIGKYTLTEITAPDGYEVEESVEFEVYDTGEIQHVTMKDAPYREIVISKTDVTGGPEIEGAHLDVTDADGNVVEEWVSGKEPHTFTLPSGKYTLTERIPANGYTTAESIEFEVIKRDREGDFEVQNIEMIDAPTKVYISKQDITTKAELPGAELIIKDKDGRQVERWISTKEPHYIEKLPIGKYTLTEVTAPNGYKVAETIEFEVKDTADEQRVVMYDEPAPTPRVPATGDDLNETQLMLIIAVIAAFLVLGFLLLSGKNRQNRKYPTSLQ